MNYHLVLCSETLVLNFRHFSEIIIPGFDKPYILRRNSFPRACGMCIYIKSCFCAARFKKYECRCHEIMAVIICSRFYNFFIFSLYRNAVLDNSIFYRVSSSMAQIQSRDIKSSFIFFYTEAGKLLTSHLSTHLPIHDFNIIQASCSQFSCLPHLFIQPLNIVRDPL